MTEVQNKGYLDEETRLKVQSEIEGAGIKGKVLGTPTKVKKGDRVCFQYRS
ncbi:MAG: hypothetical protein LKF87_14620 [Clostridium tyrobutyricum]|uniref:hypothetical protein n=1 Tax=Clostridium tyrobutyricum TaxID=1519 RepID=UPI002430FD93|nr:hypothetical protein [Clostridium tyrobutyricum]MCH4237542.1 hypothetical protein [Clostridium tyrobutyricum]MCH4260147.1 hypothetical protein [Clostridium tyrobutyricum]MCI2011743.1 hypothetical protein [Clostridium tyrobutyricum]